MTARDAAVRWLARALATAAVWVWLLFPLVALGLFEVGATEWPLIGAGPRALRRALVAGTGLAAAGCGWTLVAHAERRPADSERARRLRTAMLLCGAGLQTVVLVAWLAGSDGDQMDRLGQGFAMAGLALLAAALSARSTALYRTVVSVLAVATVPLAFGFLPFGTIAVMPAALTFAAAALVPRGRTGIAPSGATPPGRVRPAYWPAAIGAAVATVALLAAGVATTGQQLQPSVPAPDVPALRAELAWPAECDTVFDEPVCAHLASVAHLLAGHFLVGPRQAQLTRQDDRFVLRVTGRAGSDDPEAAQRSLELLLDRTGWTDTGSRRGLLLAEHYGERDLYPWISGAFALRRTAGGVMLEATVESSRT